MTYEINDVSSIQDIERKAEDCNVEGGCVERAEGMEALFTTAHSV